MDRGTNVVSNFILSGKSRFVELGQLSFILGTLRSEMKMGQFILLYDGPFKSSKRLVNYI